MKYILVVFDKQQALFNIYIYIYIFSCMHTLMCNYHTTHCTDLHGVAIELPMYIQTQMYVAYPIIFVYIYSIRMYSYTSIYLSIII